MGKKRMSDQTQALLDAPGGGKTELVYSPEQLAEMQAIPSRPVLEDGTKNPFYNQKMDPGSDRWDAYAYFKRQPQVEVFVHHDPETPGLEVFRMSINGFSLPCYPGRRQTMPQDFVDLLRQRNHRFDVYERRLVSARDDEEGSLSMTVGGMRPRPFVRQIVD